MVNMKKIFTLSLILTICQLSFAQRYVEEIFDEVTVTSNVLYGFNPTALTLGDSTIAEAITQPLVMDIYEPTGDNEAERPVMLVFHTGNFLPPVLNAQIQGTKLDSSTVEICTQLAKRGFVAAAVEYRDGWNPLAQTQPIRALGLIQAAYRGIQDGRVAVRFMRKEVEENNNPFRIDPDKISAFGTGTGGYLVLGMATLDDYSEIALAENEQGKFLLDLNMDGTPETPMVLEAYHGNIEGTTTVVAPDGAFGYPAGDTTTLANHVGYSSDIQLSINIGGAVGDVSWIDENTPPTISIQSPADPFAPYESGTLIVPTTGDPIVEVQGGLEIAMAQAAFGNNASFTDGIFTDEITQEAKDNAAAAGHEYVEGLYSFNFGENSGGLEEGVVIDWWDPTSPSPLNSPGMGFPWNTIPHPTGVGTYHDQGLLRNEGMSAEKARGNIAKIMTYVIPRTCLALDLPECNYKFTNTEEVIEGLNLTLSPNPVEGTLNIDADEKLIQSVEIFSLDGSLLAKFNNINTNQYAVNRAEIGTGIYMVKVGFEEGFTTQKVVSGV